MISPKIQIYLFFISTLFVGLYLNENSSGGAKTDFEYLYPFVIEFSKNFTSGINLFVSNPGSLIHSPFFYIIIGYLLKFLNNLLLIKILYLSICCSLPYIFYCILKTKYKVNYEYLFFISLIIFLSPYFRSTAIWLLGDNLSIIFFSLSIFFYLKSLNENKNIYNYYLCVIFLILCCYIRYYYFIFFIYFLFEFIKKLNFTELLKIFLVSIIISIPEIIYLFYLIFNLDFITFLSSRADGNYLENSIIIFSIMFFYLLPFLYGNLKNILRFYYKNYINLIFFFIFNLCLFIIDQFFYDFLNIESNLGGGVILKLLIILNLNYEIFLLFIFYISLLTFDYFFKGNRIKNYGLFLILILCFPMPVIYQKYLDPLFIIIFFGLVQSDNLRKIIQEKSVSLLSLYVYFTLFLFFSLNYYM